MTAAVNGAVTVLVIFELHFRNPDEPNIVQCGATLISPKYAISAGHCFHEHKDNFVVVAGAYKVSHYFSHP